MKSIYSEKFLLDNKVGIELYERLSNLPIIDYHNHLPVETIQKNLNFKNISDLWINYDHYKWRVMRLNGIEERYCSGNGSDLKKFQKWVETAPWTIRNPIYHWTLMELKDYFDIDGMINPKYYKKFWMTMNEKLLEESFKPINLLTQKNVEILCTTDDAVDDLSHHKKLSSNNAIKVLPTFRPDNAFNIHEKSQFVQWIERLSCASGIDIKDIDSFLKALNKQHEHFNKHGCKMSDHGIEQIIPIQKNKECLNEIFMKALDGRSIGLDEFHAWQYFLMLEFAKWNKENDWTMQLHLGAIRNNNEKLYKEVGRDVGCDSIGDFSHARNLNTYFSTLNNLDSLPNTIIYNSNPKENYVFSTISGNFFEDNVVGKIKFGAAWWFLDSEQGIINQINALSETGLFSRFVGMVTDSRSFLSFSRHDYFRRIICNLIGNDVARGTIPKDIDWLEKVLTDIFYTNSKKTLIREHD